MWLYLCLTSTILSGFTSIAMKKCSKSNNSITLSLVGTLISDIVYITIGICLTNVLQILV